MALSVMMVVLYELIGTSRGGEDGGFWRGAVDGDYDGPLWVGYNVILKTNTRWHLCKRCAGQVKTVKESSTASIFNQFTQTGWRANELDVKDVDFLVYRTAVILLLGSDYRHPRGEAPGTHDIHLTSTGKDSESDEDYGGGDDSVAGNKRKGKSGRKTRCSAHKLEEGSLTR